MVFNQILKSYEEQLLSIPCEPIEFGIEAIVHHSKIKS